MISEILTTDEANVFPLVTVLGTSSSLSISFNIFTPIKTPPNKIH